MDVTRWRAQMRQAIHRGDGPAVVGLLDQSGLPDTVLQLAGEGLLAALAQGVEGAAEVAALVIKALRDRGWRGDDELADHLAGLLGVAAMPSLRPLPVDLDELAGIREGDWFEGVEGTGRIDLETGRVWPQPEIGYAGSGDEEEPQRWLWVDPDTTRRGACNDMEDFISGLPDPRLRERMLSAIETTEAFRRFEGALTEFPIEIEQWHAFCDDRRRGRSRSWLAGAGYCQAPPTAPRLEI